MDEEESPVHQVLKTGSKRLIIVGDIHGCFEELMNLLNLCNSKDDDIICLVGDLVNKGPASVEVVRYARTTPNVYAVMGNHDLKAIKAYRSWANGGKLKKKYKYIEKMSKEDYDWLYNLPYTITFPDQNAIVVHAGLVPNVELEDQNLVAMVTMRNLSQSPDGSWQPLERPNAGVAWGSVWNGPLHAFFGHDAKRGLQQWRYATGLDTGCSKGFHLTACVLPGGELVSVPAQFRVVPPKPNGILDTPDKSESNHISITSAQDDHEDTKNYQVVKENEEVQWESEDNNDCMQDCKVCSVM
mmetsp:Transcript_30425/g.40179  ORF Transcript_30425/g.40179 Transcript_30425/m.40179 type:complete len:299 (+) Transcript_30425:162-1058(+)